MCIRDRLPSVRSLDARATILADSGVPAELREPIATRCAGCGLDTTAYADVTGDGREAVSYTHLDVYKRQLQCGRLQFVVRGNDIDRAHPVHVVGGIGPPEEEDLPRRLLPDHPGQVCRPVARVERAHVSICLLYTSRCV